MSIFLRPHQDVVTVTYLDESKFRARLFYAKRNARNVEESVIAHFDLRVVLWSEFNPGNYVEVEESSDVTFEDFLAELRKWSDRLRGEIVLVSGFQKEFENFQAQINKELDEHYTDASAHFSEDEKDEILAKLREFEIRLEEQKQQNNLTQARLDQLKQAIADLNQAASVLPKKAWARTAVSKIYVLSKKAINSKTGQTLIAEAMKRLVFGLTDTP